MSEYRVLPGPEHFLPPAAASMGIQLPNPGEAHINGVIAPEEKAYEEAARQFLMAKVPTIFPGPLVLWAWNEKAAKKATAIRHLYNTLKECVQPSQRAMLIPMPDYRPKYPKINPEVEINPNHPNLTTFDFELTGHVIEIGNRLLFQLCEIHHFPPCYRHRTPLDPLAWLWITTTCLN
ncbi:MAG: hypothetical protein HP491_14500 [Nitrospira sp.]|nr:hypothetical protein [Nitrospira sp.]